MGGEGLTIALNILATEQTTERSRKPGRGFDYPVPLRLLVYRLRHQPRRGLAGGPLTSCGGGTL